MNLAGKIICRTTGLAALGYTLYDTYECAKAGARKSGIAQQEKYLEDAYFNSRTLNDISVTQNNTREKVFDLRTRNPIPSFWGKIKGGAKSAFNTLVNYFPLLICASLAMAAKGVFAKIGAAGVALLGVLSIAENGFGFGKKHPFD